VKPTATFHIITRQASNNKRASVRHLIEKVHLAKDCLTLSIENGTEACIGVRLSGDITHSCRLYAKSLCLVFCFYGKNTKPSWNLPSSFFALFY